MSKDRLITKPPKGTKIIPDVVHRDFTTIVDVWRLYAVPNGDEVLRDAGRTPASGAGQGRRSGAASVTPSSIGP